MALPAELILLRHGESEANVVQNAMKDGRFERWPEGFDESPNWEKRLTERGRRQSVEAGEYLRAEVGEWFDMRLFSIFARTRETAGLLGTDGPNWHQSAYLHERDWGEFDNANPELFQSPFFKLGFAERKSNPMFWTPPNGENMMQVAARFDRTLATLHRDVERGKLPERGKVIMVTHGEVVDAARIPLERMSEVDFHESFNSDDPHERVNNCQVVQYTRRTDPTDPDSPLEKTMTFRRSVCPWDRTKSSDDWVPIVRKTYTNEDLLAEVETFPLYLAG